MTALRSPDDAIEALRRKVEQRWAEAVCAQPGTVFTVPLRPAVATGKAVEQLGHGVWHDWHMRWRAFHDRLPAGVQLQRKPLTIRGVTGEFPATLTADLDGARSLIAGTSTVDIEHARDVASAIRAADGVLTPATLRAACRLPAGEVQVLVNALRWLHHNPDAGAWTLRQLPIPGMHTKWLQNHGALLRDVAGRDVRDEVLPRPAVIHLTYVDPHYAASGRRRHDAWTTGDVHDVAYRPRTVLVVENRDCRLWFPPVSDTVVVEGGGKAAAALLAGVPWISAADHVVYWGDIDADGYAILDHLRVALARPLTSILMDVTDLHRHAEQGVNHDKHGRPLKPCPEHLTHLTGPETAAYNIVATAGPTPFRRIEQEAIPLAEAAARLLAQVS